jgi:hypothetical protein
MTRCLLVLDMDLLAVDEAFGLEPINYLLAQQEHGPCEVVVLSLVSAGQPRLPGLDAILAYRSGGMPVAGRPGHDLSADAWHRMRLAVRHLCAIGCQASGFISAENVVSAVRSEAVAHDYDQVILATGRISARWLARALRRDPVRRLRRRWGPRLIVFPLGGAAPHPTPAFYSPRR